MPGPKSSSSQSGQNADHNTDDSSFAGYRWTYFASITNATLRLRVQNFIDSTNWDALIEYANRLRNGKICKLLPDIGLGYNHLVRIIEFQDDVRWIARLRMPPLSRAQARSSVNKQIMKNEYNTILLVKQKTKIPIPSVHAIELDAENIVKAQFMLMDCLRGNAGIDLSMEVSYGVHRLPFRQKLILISQVDLSRVQLPRIGTILRQNEDGSFDQGPIPGIGGPFETATEFFQAWAAKVEFGISEAKLREAAGSFADELSFSASSFISLVETLAGNLSVQDKGPFPLCHGDFGHNNMVFDDEYNLLGVIDWEAAYAGPWELFGEFPLTLSMLPPDMDAPWNYDESGLPRDAESLQRCADRRDYVTAVIEKEQEMNVVEGCRLSVALQDSRRQDLAAAMRLYSRGKPGYYSKVIEKFSGAVTC
ncbi:uncharacterized protein N7525_002689 [Penicillium rubens]|uniref:uncharacterized protein n=1 Tax=Penicillium rubens TaxID=1108849 RepID=UPI002A59F83F|nr:uncharacterized protein N7525_002689 [Penicillium rubens]KAJ5837501.1 hypothetical protein N7525_002689 [Penicillium rubens]